tara:strand:+ start:740 stop:1300 length:561 start_codon:yes stop_codon:yes gene_type:complete
MKNIFYSIFTLIILQSCSPSLTQYQTASTLGENKRSHSLATEIATNPEEGIISYRYQKGVAENTDIGLGFGISHHGHVGVGLNLKTALIKDKMALNLPIVVKGIGGTRYDFTPTILYTYNANNEKVKNTISLQFISYYSDEIKTGYLYLSHNWQIRVKKIFICPEFGLEYKGPLQPKFGVAFTFKK